MADLHRKGFVAWLFHKQSKVISQLKKNVFCKTNAIGPVKIVRPPTTSALDKPGKLFAGYCLIKEMTSLGW